MSAKHNAAIGLGCFLLGVTTARWGMNPSVVERPVQAAPDEKRDVENRLLKIRLEELENLLQESNRAVSRTARNEPPDSPPKADAADLDPASMATVRTGADVARVLGLEPARQKYFEESYERVRARLLDAERRLATVSREDGKVEIHIPPFAHEGSELRREWTTLLASALTSPERERYASLKLEEVLFPREIGLWDRYVVFDVEEHAAGAKTVDGNRFSRTYYERWTKPGEKPIDGSTRWPWSGPEAERWCRHLTKP